MDYKDNLDHWAQMINDSLNRLVVENDKPESVIYKAMRYSLLSGGKRLRPVLSLAVNEMLKGNQKDILPYACALEMIHTYSLIHDDLPTMDNDDYRRGRKTNHKVFGEDIAILAGDALLNLAFEIMLEDISLHTHASNIKGRTNAAKVVAKAAGAEGMIAGQVIDLQSEGCNITKGHLEYMHRRKTGALIKAAVQIPVEINNVTENQKKALMTYADNIGLAFQIKDDILDVEGSMEEMGKETGSDVSSGKTTFVTCYGIEKAKDILESTVEAALDSLLIFGSGANFLCDTARFISKRNN